MSIQVPKSLAAALQFAIQVAVASILFSLISFAAILIHLLIDWVSTNKLAPQFVTDGMRGLEYTTWAADIFCFLVLVVTESIRLCKRAWSIIREPADA